MTAAGVSRARSAGLNPVKAPDIPLMEDSQCSVDLLDEVALWERQAQEEILDRVTSFCRLTRSTI